MIHEATEILGRKIDLSYGQMEAVMEEIMTGKAQTAEIVSFLTALNHKGETVEEITAAVKVMRRHATKDAPILATTPPETATNSAVAV